MERSRPDSQVLCIGCFEARLGHSLTKDDFADVRMNWDGGEYHPAPAQSPVGFDENEPPPTSENV
jgi:hypothetical protein